MSSYCINCRVWSAFSRFNVVLSGTCSLFCPHHKSFYVMSLQHVLMKQRGAAWVAVVSCFHFLFSHSSCAVLWIRTVVLSSFSPCVLFSLTWTVPSYTSRIFAPLKQPVTQQSLCYVLYRWLVLSMWPMVSADTLRYTYLVNKRLRGIFCIFDYLF